jgi:hypothetical protein
VNRLDDLIARARQLPVHEPAARRYVAELRRWARPESRPARLPWLAAGFAIAAAAVLLVVVLRPRVAADPSAIRIGDRVAIVAEPSTQYRVIAADAEHTEVVVDRGTVTARLWPGAHPHRLALRGGGVEAVATGTVYALHVDDHGSASVFVHEGKVAVRRGDDHVLVAAGTSWPASTLHRDRRAADQLLALAAPPLVAPPPAAEPAIASVTDAAKSPDAPDVADVPPAPAPRVAPSHAKDPEPIVDAPRAPTLTERWRQARLLRGQGSFDAAVTECLAIADAKDATWSPIALLEAARIELGPRASPERAVALAERFEAEWSSHQLLPEARELKCRALRQLGRDAECAAQR